MLNALRLRLLFTLPRMQLRPCFPRRDLDFLHESQTLPTSSTQLAHIRLECTHDIRSRTSSMHTEAGLSQQTVDMGCLHAQRHAVDTRTFMRESMAALCCCRNLCRP